MLTALVPLSSSQQNQSLQPPPAGGLFGSSTQTSQPAQGGTLFGASTAQNMQPGGSFGNANQNASGNSGFGAGKTLFGASTAQNTQPSGSFGNASQNASGTSGFGAGKTLFGASTAQNTQPGGSFGNANQNASGTSGFGAGKTLFGASTAQNTQPGGSFGNANQNTSGTSGFGAGTNNLFAGNASTNTGGLGLFGNSTSNNQQQAQQQNNQQQAQQQNNQQQAQQQNNSLFGLSVSQPTYQPNASLLGASQYRAPQLAPFAGKLSMGQANVNQTTNLNRQATQGAVKINYDTLRLSTRFADCVEGLQNELEAMDKMIALQERFCRQIESFIPKHGENVPSLVPDVEMVREKAEDMEAALGADARGVQTQRQTLEADAKDFQRVQRVVDMLQHPEQYRFSGLNYGPHSGGTDAPGKEMDLVNLYFVPVAESQKQRLAAYAGNLVEIEQHLGVIEASAVGQAQQLAAKRVGVDGGPSTRDSTVTDLVNTLRGFEQRILAAAGSVGQCREGVNALVLPGAGGQRSSQ